MCVCDASSSRDVGYGPFGGFTYSDLPSNGVAQKALPKSLCLTSQSDVQNCASRLRHAVHFRNTFQLLLELSFCSLCCRHQDRWGPVVQVLWLSRSRPFLSDLYDRSLWVCLAVWDCSSTLRLVQLCSLFSVYCRSYSHYCGPAMSNDGIIDIEVISSMIRTR